MRILALVTDAFGGEGGIACYNRDLLTAMAAVDKEIDLHVFPRNGNPHSLPENITQLASAPGKILYSLRAIRECFRFKPQFIFCGHVFMLPLAVLLARFFRMKIWLQLHGIEAWQKPSGQIAKMISRVDMVTCVSRYTRSRFLSWADLNADKVRVLPNTVSEVFRPIARDLTRDQYNVANKKVVLTVGRLSSQERYKGHDRVLQCLPSLLRNNPDIVYLIAGDGDDRGRLEAMTKELSLQNCVHFLGKIGNEQLPALYSSADLFLMPSTGEGFGIVFLEAMACGTPAMGFDQDGSVDPLLDGKLGFISNEKNLVADIEKALLIGRPERLSESVHGVFGQENFQKQVRFLLQTYGGKNNRFETSTCAA